MTEEEKYNNVSKHLVDVEREITELEKNELISRYKHLNNEKELLEEEKSDIYKSLKKIQYKKCHHLLVTTYLIPSRISRDNDIKYCGCLKCGLDESIKISKDSHFIDYDKFSFDDKIKYDFLSNNNIDKKNITDVVCDLDLARAIYKKIIESNPKINDKLAVKYLEIALDNIRNIKTTDKREKGRIRRLSLDKKFSKWNKEDITKKF